MMAQQVPHQSSEKKRVKVYELRNNDWFDRGTGFCTAIYQVSEDGQPKDPRVVVHSEDQSDRCILETRISKEDGFQKQQETLIVWTEPVSGLDMALSFQEADGCAMIWKFVNAVQQTMPGGIAGAQDDSLSDDLAMDLPNPVSLPTPEIGNLTEVEVAMRGLNTTTTGRDALAKYIYNEGYIGKLIPLVEMAEEFESVGDLHRLCNIMKTVILLNDTTIIEQSVSDEFVIGVVGALEYDPDFPTHKANHRQWLADQGRYKEVVPIDDETIKRKIHQTYRLQYLKDVVLARILDDPTFSVLNSLIFFNQVDIVNHLQANVQFLADLFGIFNPQNQDLERKKDAVLFIQQCCAIAKSLQPPARQSLYNNFIAHGLLRVINYGLRHTNVSVRVGATDILVSMIDHDPQMIRQTLHRQIHEKQGLLTDSLIDLLLVEVDLGVKSQISDALKVLLDHCPPQAQMQSAEQYGKSNAELQARFRAQSNMDPNQEVLLVHFYETSAEKLFKPLLDLEGREDIKFTHQQASMFGYLIEIMIFFIRQHQHRSKYFLMQRNIPQRVIQLLASPEKYLKLVSIRFFRHLISMQDEFYLKQLTDQHVFGPILMALADAMPRDNLLSSAGLDLFEYIRKENLRELMKYLVENFREKLIELSNLDTFRDMVHQYDATRGFSINQESLVELEADDIARRPNAGNTRGLMEHITMDPVEEEYWSKEEEDEDEELPRKAEKTVPAANGNTTPSRPLVDYVSDEEPDETVETKITTSTPEATPSGSVSDENSDPGTPPSAVKPPERLSEKRRREEDDEDELGNLMANKRRNSTSINSNSSNSILGGAALRRKKGSMGGSGNGTKISINLSPSPQPTPITADDGGEAQG
ncbi:hypothetical protein MKZ38_006140 [Zalerion maritima]|uniref:Serine/threonine-protein phosphatase 4 regulatory subunit 3-like central domain-containing protein n=1 Tax=Zalerion maritima TaxID=339359 RepID=A0AAD5WPX8_9PEZI|nr:hypothetical protein MKZ38_006140 [Zalerion maritima]